MEGEPGIKSLLEGVSVYSMFEEGGGKVISGVAGMRWMSMKRTVFKAIRIMDTSFKGR